MIKYIVSACLVGIDTRYDGKNCKLEHYSKMVKNGIAIPFCPEQAGGLPTPRPPAEIWGGDGFDVLEGRARVMSKEGEDVTCYFVKGAKETLKLAKLLGVKKAILKSKSPSCGYNNIYDGSFRGRLKKGMGVTASYLKSKGIEVIDSDAFVQIKDKF